MEEPTPAVPGAVTDPAAPVEMPAAPAAPATDMPAPAAPAPDMPAPAETPAPEAPAA